jgi:endonuclease/exonuclease/phosphatase family metal-dependent hydrolase
VQRVLRWANVLIVLLTLGAYFAPAISPSVFWPFAFLGLLYPTLLAINIIFIAVWAFQRKWYFALSLGVILVGWSQFRTIIGMSLSATPPPNGLRIMTYNVFGFGYVRNINRSVPLWREQMAEYHPDILCLQEFAYYPTVDKYFLPAIKNEGKMPYGVWRKLEEFAIFSRYPILNSEVHFFGSTNGYRIADLQIGEKKVRVFNVHLQSNAITHLANQVAESGSLEKKTWLNIRGIFGRFRRAARKRTEQSQLISRLIAQSPYPVILCGDFNDVPQSYSYQTLTTYLKDTFKSRGWGLGFTYAGIIPGLRIDYVLTDPAFPIYRCQRGRPAFSDHRPVIVDLQIPGQ